MVRSLAHEKTNRAETKTNLPLAIQSKQGFSREECTCKGEGPNGKLFFSGASNCEKNKRLGVEQCPHFWCFFCPEVKVRIGLFREQTGRTVECSFSESEWFYAKSVRC